MNTATAKRIFRYLPILMIFVMAWAPMAEADSTKGQPLQSIENSDLNGDDVVNADDLAIFGAKYMQNLWTLVDWCGFYDATTSGQYFDGKSKKGKDKAKNSKYPPPRARTKSKS